MRRLDKDVFVCLDCETTGLDTNEDRVIEVAAVRFTTEEILDEFETLINPERDIPATSTAIHNITHDMVFDKPTLEKVLPQLLSFIGPNIIVGHGIHFDIQMLINGAQRSKVPCSLHQNKSLDTLRMARLYGGSPVNSLEQLRIHFNIEAEGAHRAKGDVLVNLAVFRRLAEYYHSTEQIFAALSKPILFKIMPLGKHKGRSIQDIPLDYLLWAARQEFDQDLLYSLRSEINRRKQKNLFSQATNPFANL